jgi:hypothetical protein
MRGISRARPRRPAGRLTRRAALSPNARPLSSSAFPAAQLSTDVLDCDVTVGPSAMRPAAVGRGRWLLLLVQLDSERRFDRAAADRRFRLGAAVSTCAPARRPRRARVAAASRRSLLKGAAAPRQMPTTAALLRVVHVNSVRRLAAVTADCPVRRRRQRVDVDFTGAADVEVERGPPPLVATRGGRVFVQAGRVRAAQLRRRGLATCRAGW